MEIITDYISNIGNQFIDPKKRIFIGYLLIAIFIAAFWLVYFRKLNLREAINKIFDKKIIY